MGNGLRHLADGKSSVSENLGVCFGGSGGATDDLAAYFIVLNCEGFCMGT
jgi:hypothetical protein